MANVPDDHGLECIRKSTRETSVGAKDKYVLAMSADLKPVGKRYISLWASGTNGDGEYKYISYYQNGAYELTAITCVADVTGSLGGKYFTLSAGDNSEDFYVWYDVDDGSSDPAPASKTGIEVNISADDTAATVVTNTIAAINSTSTEYYLELVAATVDGSTDKLTITNRFPGVATASADVDTAFTVAQTTAGTKGTLIRIDKFQYDSDGEYTTLDVEDL